MSESDKLRDKYNEKIQGLAFFHIPLQEYMYVWSYYKTAGIKNEPVQCSHIQSNTFRVFQQTKNIKAMFCGHDHSNDYYGFIGDMGLYYGRQTGYGGVGTLPKGARVIKLTEKPKGNGGYDFDYATYVIEADGKIIHQDDMRYHFGERFQNICGYEVPDNEVTAS